MQTEPGQEWLREVGARERALATARTHLAAEVDTDVDVIMATVSRDPWFVVPERRTDRLVLDVREGTEEVHRYYEERGGSYVVVASDQLASVAAPWYVLNESAATLRQTAPIGGMGRAGDELVVNSVILFPTAGDGIRGEIAVTRHPFAAVLAGEVPPRPVPDGALAHLPAAALDSSRLLDRVVAGLTADPAGGDVGALLAPHHALAVRVDGPARRIRATAEHAESAAVALESLMAGADDIAVVGRLATEWYVFVEYLLRLEEGRRLRRLALVHPVRDGRLEGTFGYGLETVDR